MKVFDMDYDGFLATDIHHRITSPTCEDLGLPRDLGHHGYGFHSEVDLERRVGSPGSLRAFSTDFRATADLKYDLRNPNNPFSPFCAIPLPALYGQYDYNVEPAFIRKRNERERERVRCVNDGYARLRDALPLENKEKRISKVETLRCAIRYIQQLQKTLENIEQHSHKRQSQEDVENASENSENCARAIKNEAQSHGTKIHNCSKRRKTKR